MSELKPFEILLNRQPTDKEIQNLYRIKNALDIQDNDALWVVLCALESYNTLYSQYPEKINQSLEITLNKLLSSIENHPQFKEKNSTQIQTKNSPLPANTNVQIIGLSIIGLILFGATCISLGYLAASHKSPLWFTSDNLFSNILKTPSFLLIGLVGLICCLFLSYTHKDEIFKGKRLDIILYSAIFFCIAFSAFISIL